MTVSVLVPRRPDQGHRDRAWEWVRRRWVAALPGGAEIVESDDGVGDPDLFSRPAAINRCAASASGSVLVVADCDTACDVDAARAAVALADTDGDWTLSDVYVQLDKRTSRLALDCDPDVPLSWLPSGRVVWAGRSWSGVVVVPRAAFDLVGGFDERHIGWGADDACFGLAVETLWRAPRRDGRIYHLWHPRGDQENGWHRNSVAQRELTERYMAAAGDTAAMAALLEERAR